MDTFAYIWLALLVTSFIGIMIHDVVEVSEMGEDTPEKYDEIHDRRRKMNKRERIEQLEEQVENLERELKYVEHKNDKAKIEKKRCFYGAEYSVKYVNNKERSIKTLELGAYVDDNLIELVKETNKEIYIKIPYRVKGGIVYHIKIVNKEDNTVKEMDTQDFETLKELFETKPKKSSKKEKKND